MCITWMYIMTEVNLTAYLVSLCIFSIHAIVFWILYDTIGVINAHYRYSKKEPILKFLVKDEKFEIFVISICIVGTIGLLLGHIWILENMF